MNLHKEDSAFHELYKKRFNLHELKQPRCNFHELLLLHEPARRLHCCSARGEGQCHSCTHLNGPVKPNIMLKDAIRKITPTAANGRIGDEIYHVWSALSAFQRRSGDAPTQLVQRMTVLPFASVAEKKSSEQREDEDEVGMRETMVMTSEIHASRLPMSALQC